MAADGLITIPSSGTVKATLDRLESEVKARGITVFARIDHAAGAASAGLAMRPTELLIFGNAAAGTPLMQATQTIASICRSRRWHGKMRRGGCGCRPRERVVRPTTTKGGSSGQKTILSCRDAVSD
jgi:hypothetical protein